MTSGLEQLHLGEAGRGADPAVNPQALCKQAGLIFESVLMRWIKQEPGICKVRKRNKYCILIWQ